MLCDAKNEFVTFYNLINLDNFLKYCCIEIADILNNVINYKFF